MIGGVVSASVILFMGYSIERHLSPIRMSLAAVLSVLVLTVVLRDGQALARVFVSGEGIAGLWNSVTTGNSLFGTIATVVAVLGSAVGGHFIQRRFPRMGNAISDLVLAIMICMAIMMELRFGISPTAQMAISTVVGVIALCCHIAFPVPYILITSSVLGSSVIALLFSKFYFLPFWVGLVIAIVFGSIGYASQSHGYRKRMRNERIFNGDETA